MRDTTAVHNVIPGRRVCSCGLLLHLRRHESLKENGRARNCCDPVAKLLIDDRKVSLEYSQFEWDYKNHVDADIYCFA